MIKRTNGQFDYSANMDKPFSVQQQEFEETLRKANSKEKDAKSFVEAMQAKLDVSIMYSCGYGCERSRMNSLMWKQEWKSDYAKLNGQPNNNSCFVTTAVCDSFGKPDDCFELMTFRKFRDTWLVNQPDGKSLIAEYYSVAPKIVANINKLADSAQIYKTIWKKYLEPCLSFIRKGDNLSCKNKYVEMIRELKKIYA